jgi:hypothetical protein
MSITFANDGSSACRVGTRLRTELVFAVPSKMLADRATVLCLIVERLASRGNLAMTSGHTCSRRRQSGRRRLGNHRLTPIGLGRTSSVRFYRVRYRSWDPCFEIQKTGGYSPGNTNRPCREPSISACRRSSRYHMVSAFRFRNSDQA